MNPEKIIKTDLWFLAGGGAMGQLIREKDWSKTSLGAPETWPQSLRTMVAVMLDNPFGMYIAWGNEYIQLYNDAYRPILGATKHPQALGISTKETFSEVWDNIIGSMFDGVMKGKAVGFPDLMLPLNRSGFVEECYFDFAYSPIRKDDGEVGGVLVTVVETTNKKKTEEALKESETRFRAIADDAPVFIFLAGENAEVEYLNKTWREYTGISTNDSRGRAWAEITHIDDIDPATKLYMDGFNKRESCSFENRQKGMDGIYRTILWKATPRFSPNGQFIGMMGVGLDIHERKKSEEKLRESEQKVRALVENAPFPIAVYVGKEMIIELANPSIIDIWGKGQDVIGKSFKDLLPELDNQSVFEQIQKVLETGESFHTKNTPLDLITDGKPFTYYFNYSFTPLYDISGNIYGVMNTGVDLTGLNIAKKKVEESEEQLRIAIEGGEFGTFDFIPQTRQLIWSAKTKELFGLPPDAHVDYETYIAAMHPEDRVTSRAIARQQENLKEGGLYELEYRIMGISDGKLRWLRSRGKATYNEKGEAIRYTGVIQDITQQKEAAETVRESNQRFRNTMKQAPVGMAILRGPQYIVEMANDAYLQLVDKKEAEFVGNPLFATLPEVKEVVHPLLDSVLKTGVPYHGNEAPIPINRYGKQDVFYFDFLYYPLKEEDGKISGVIVVVTEVTEKVESRNIIEERKRLYETITQNTPDLIYVFDLNYRFTYANEALLNMWGRTWDDAIGKSMLANGYEPWHAEMHEREIDRVIATKKPVRGEVSFPHASLGKRMYDYIFTPVINEKGEVEAVTGTTRDISDIKIAEEELKKSEEQFRLLADSMAQHIWTSDPEGSFNYFNQSVFKYSGLSQEQIHKEGWLQIVHPDDKDESIKTWIDSVSTGKDFLFEHRFRRYDGEYRWQLSRAVPQRDQAGTIQMWVGTSTDIHDKKVTEVQLDKLVKERTIQLERSNEDLQQFAHVASHDLKEPLRKIKIFTSRAKEEYAASLPVPVVHFLEKITDASTRMQMMVDGVLSFSSVNSTEQPIEKIDLNDTFKNVKNDLEIVIEQKKAKMICGDLPTIEGGAILINQLFYNLVHNSLKFSKENEAPLIEISSTRVNEGGRDLAKISLRDNGIGFSQSNSEQIFETFVRLNSKDKYEGTGLGLSLCKKIVERHNGTIEAKSKEMEGTTFIVTLPLEQIQKHI